MGLKGARQSLYRRLPGQRTINLTVPQPDIQAGGEIGVFAGVQAGGILAVLLNGLTHILKVMLSTKKISQLLPARENSQQLPPYPWGPPPSPGPEARRLST